MDTPAIAILIAAVLASAMVCWRELGGSGWRHLGWQAGAGALTTFVLHGAGADAGCAFEIGALGALCFAVARIDFSTLVIPNALVAAIALLALIAPLPGSRMDQAAATLTLGGLFLIVRVGYARRRGVEGLGLGDVKLAAVIGATLGLEGALIATTAAAALTALLMTAPVRVFPAAHDAHMPGVAPFGVALAATLAGVAGYMALNA